MKMISMFSILVFGMEVSETALPPGESLKIFCPHICLDNKNCPAMLTPSMYAAPSPLVAE